MNTAGVDGALLTSTFAAYRFDPSYAIEVQRSYPERLALITPIDPSRDDVTDVIAAWAATADCQSEATGFVPRPIAN